MRRVSTGLVVAATALLIAGCTGFDGDPTTSQNGTIGPVSVHFVVCAGILGSNCAASTGPASTNAPTQITLAALVPNGTSVPSSISTVPNPEDVTDLDGNTLSHVTFTKNADYGATVETSAPAPSGFEWVGYTTPYIAYNYTGSGNQLFTATAALGIPQGKNGAPVNSIFKYQVVIGGWEWEQNGASSSVPPPAVYDCGAADSGDLAGPYYIPSSGSSTPSGTPYFEGDCNVASWPNSTPPSTLSYSLRDAWVVPGKTVSAGKGKTAKLTFTFDYVGTKPGKAFTLSASSGKVSTKSIKPSGKTSKKVTVTVHTSKHSGTYNITLTAKYPGGQVRKGTDKVKVH
jgi:hypothetical protein